MAGLIRLEVGKMDFDLLPRVYSRLQHLHHLIWLHAHRDHRHQILLKCAELHHPAAYDFAGPRGWVFGLIVLRCADGVPSSAHPNPTPRQASQCQIGSI